MNLARDVLRMLEKNGECLLLVESCTGGLIASQITKIPGGSKAFAGSLVTYQVFTKRHVLRSAEAKKITEASVVSAKTAQVMARDALNLVPHATIAASITGHMGPDAPPKLDGVFFISVARRRSRKRGRSTENTVAVVKTKRESVRSTRGRVHRQKRASQALLSMVRSLLSSSQKGAKQRRSLDATYGTTNQQLTTNRSKTKK